MRNSIINEAFDMEEYEVIDHDTIQHLPSINIVHDEYDDKDAEIEDQFQDVYDKAMSAFDMQQDAAADIEGKYLARNTEVANQLLSTALSAAKEKANLKQHSDKLKLQKSNNPMNTGNTTNIQNNNILMDRNELLKIMGNDK